MSDESPRNAPPATMDTSGAATYRGRFAPSPTGPLHFGSLVAALGSYIDARAHGGIWLVRMEDIDPPRVVPGACDDILRTLEAFGLYWDEAVIYQSTRHAAYEAALARLAAQGDSFACACTRRDLADSHTARGHAPVYPGTCRNGLPPGRAARAVRARVNDETIVFDDRVQGPIAYAMAEEIGDFVIRRADGHYAYQLAVVVDDAAQGITDIVRGADLIDSTPRQIHLQRRLGLPTPHYAHLPTVLDTHGEKLSKRTRAAPVDGRRPGEALVRALNFLGQEAPEALRTASPAVVLDWAIAHWRLERIPRANAIPAA
jgi:glutamyl-Q tRNA(Asp) synthetase